MIEKITLKPHLIRKSTHYKSDDAAIPAALFTSEPVKPDLTGFPYPLPSAKENYTCSAEYENIRWFGADNGLTRYDPDAENRFDKIMFFSADRDLLDNDIKAVLPEKNGVWVLTYSGVTHIELVEMTAEELGRTLLDETLAYVDRNGMVSQKYLREKRNFSTAFPHGSSDNDGGFTSYFSMGEIFRYAVLKREKGADDEETLEAKKVAIRALDACLLLMYIHGRGDGFVARTYIFDGEPLPEDGVFFKRQGDKATIVANKNALEKGLVGISIDCSAPIPDRLKYLYEEAGKTLDDIIYKADTSSDEITIQMLNCLFAHKFLACDEPELDELIKKSVKGIMAHILDNGLVLRDYAGLPTTWARWDEPYFATDGDGYIDACLNSAEVLFLLKAVMEITGETGRWLEAYNHLAIDRGYAERTQWHFDRLYQASIAGNFDFPEGIMYGDHFLATASFYGLCTLEKDEKLLAMYKKGYKAWRTSLAGEHNPGYDFLYILANPEDTLDSEKIREWFARTNMSRLAASVSLEGRHDVAVRTLRGGYRQISTLLPPDERFISKYDRDPLEYKNEDSGGAFCIESCFVYTFAYWLGRYYGFID